MSIFRKNKTKGCVSKIVVTESSASEQSDGYNKLRDQLMAVNADGNTKVIQIESSLDNECKTDVTCNLAVSLRCAGNKVAVVETDFRFPEGLDERRDPPGRFPRLPRGQDAANGLFMY